MNPADVQYLNFKFDSMLANDTVTDDNEKKADSALFYSPIPNWVDDEGKKQQQIFDKFKYEALRDFDTTRGVREFINMLRQNIILIEFKKAPNSFKGSRRAGGRRRSKSRRYRRSRARRKY